MSAVVLSIGYRSYLLPSDKGVTTVMQVLARAVPCRYDRFEKRITIEDDGAPVEVGMAFVSPDTRIEGAVENVPVKPVRPRRLALEGGRS